DADRLLVEALALGSQLDEDPAAVGRVRQTAEQAGPLHTVESVRHRPARELHRAGELPWGAAIRLFLPVQEAGNLVLGEVELEFGHRLIHGAFEAAAEAADAVDDPLDLWIEHGQALMERFQETVDVVALLRLGLGGWRHRSIFDVKLLDVKLSVL